MDKKIKILVAPSDRTGVGYFRSTKPHIALEKFYPDEFHVDIVFDHRLDDDAWLSQYDIIHYHRTFGPYERCKELIDKAEGLGITTIMDLDDYWAPGPHHPAYAMIRQAKMPEKILANLKEARHVTTTTPLFAKEIGKHNRSVHVIPNAIDPEEAQYIPNPEPSDRIRIGWLGGSSHLEDLRILTHMVNRLKSDHLMDKIQFVLCGYDLRGTITEIDQKTNTQKQRPIRPMESVWYLYEKIFTSNYTTISEDYKNFLLTFKREEYPDVANESYRRVWTKPISTYATNYNLFDISLAPLSEHTFNKVKSQLKVIEAGFHKKALVAQDYGPYNIDLVDAYKRPEAKGELSGFNPEGNAYLVPTKKNHKLWYQHIKRLILNPEQIKVLSDNLHDTVKDKYSIEATSRIRRQLYLDILDKKK